MKLINLTLLLLLIFVSTALAQDPTVEFTAKVDQFLAKHLHKGLVNYSAIKAQPEELNALVDYINNFDISTVSGDVEKTFWINSYNILTIQAVVSKFPIKSPMDVRGFFDGQKYQVGDEKLTLNDIENKKLRDKFGDARIHFALVCAARSCPPLVEAFYPDRLDEQLTARTSEALNDARFTRVDNRDKKVRISEIFRWYGEDFEKDGTTIREYLNKYRDQPIPEDYSIGYYTYDWALNIQSANRTGFLIERDNLQAYTPSKLLVPGQIELKQFNNLYTQTSFFDENGDKTDGGGRQTYFTGFLYFNYGWRKNINIGFDTYFRSVDISPNDTGMSSQLSRSALTSIGPKIKVSPFSALPTFSMQTLVLFPLASNLETEPFLDYDAVQWWTQLFLDLRVADDFLLYLENGYFVRFREQSTDFLTPIKGILNYYPTDKWTFYFPTEFWPGWGDSGLENYFVQLGLGAKYLITPNLEIEALYTNFVAGKSQGAGVTYNVGFRFIR